MNRILTLEVEITDKDQASWIWESHIGDYPVHGMRVQAIHEGPIPEEIEED